MSSGLAIKVKKTIYRTIRGLQPRMRFPPMLPHLVTDARSHRDSVRYETIGLALATIERENVRGAVAEVGVFRGMTSKFIHMCVPKRTLYLFDTFNGFPASAMAENGVNNPGDEHRFRNTSVASVRKVVGSSPEIRIRSGVFPESAAGLEHDTFAFVMLDLDIYGPTLAALEFFYPRLIIGGYLFVHDYNSPESGDAMRRALGEFLVDKPEKLVEIPDEWGSAVFRKI
nr:hypothetical protein Hi04_10k_c4773_00033 [uncultured bacterium]